MPREKSEKLVLDAKERPCGESPGSPSRVLRRLRRLGIVSQGSATRTAKHEWG